MGTHSDIQWLSWSPETFAKAKAEDKPILLDLTAVWCHWCHVMDNTSYSDDDVIKLVNLYFVPVRVDIDKHPDIRERYNFGGFPTTAFLTPDGEVLTGATYVPPERMRTLLLKVRQAYHESRDDISKTIEEEHREHAAPPKAEGDVSAEAVYDVLGYCLLNFDPIYGGFGQEPKFPPYEPLDFLLMQYWKRESRDYLNIVTATLDAMARGKVWDDAELGFFRYSVTRDWNTPHYEKMCDTNAGLLRNYVDAYAVTGKEEYRRIAEGIATYVQRNLRHPDGGFYGSQDADEKYYQHDAAGRQKHAPPAVDKTVYVEWSAMMASSFLRAGAVLERDDLTEDAQRALRLIGERGRLDGGLVHHLPAAVGAEPAFLADYARLGRALVDAYQASAEPWYLAQAEWVARDGLPKLAADDGGFYDRLPRDDDVGLLRRRQKPVMDNAVAADFFNALYYITGKEEYREAARNTLRTFTKTYENYSIFGAAYAKAVDLFLDYPVKTVLVGSLQDVTARAMLKRLLRTYEPRRIVQVVDTEDGSALAAVGFPPEPSPAIYVCVENRCSRPLTKGSTLEAEITAFVKGNGSRGG